MKGNFHKICAVVLTLGAIAPARAFKNAEKLYGSKGFSPFCDTQDSSRAHMSESALEDAKVNLRIQRGDPKHCSTGDAYFDFLFYDDVSNGRNSAEYVSQAAQVIAASASSDANAWEKANMEAALDWEIMRSCQPGEIVLRRRYAIGNGFCADKAQDAAIFTRLSELHQKVSALLQGPALPITGPMHPLLAQMLIESITARVGFPDEVEPRRASVDNAVIKNAYSMLAQAAGRCEAWGLYPVINRGIMGTNAMFNGITFVGYPGLLQLVQDTNERAFRDCYPNSNRSAKMPFFGSGSLDGNVSEAGGMYGRKTRWISSLYQKQYMALSDQANPASIQTAKNPNWLKGPVIQSILESPNVDPSLKNAVREAAERIQSSQQR